MGGCHTLAMADGQLVGDPIEKQAFEGIQWRHDGRRTSTGNGMKIILVKRFLFESALKRMSVIVNFSEEGTEDHRVLCKGAPEVIRDFLKEVP